MYLIFVLICLALLASWAWARARTRTPNINDYPEGQVLINNIDIIRAELNGIMKLSKWSVWTYSNDIEGSPNFTDLGKDGIRDYLENSNTIIGDGVPSWRIYPLVHEGEVFSDASSSCPGTIDLLKNIGLYPEGDIINAGFSCMEPGSKTPIHSDNDKRFYRMHIPVILPADSDSTADLGLRVDGKVLKWKMGEYFVFDDTYVHQAWNNTDQIRIVLLVDIKRK